MSRWLVSVATPGYSGQLCYRLSLHDTLDQLVVRIRVNPTRHFPVGHYRTSASMSRHPISQSVNLLGQGLDPVDNQGGLFSLLQSNPVSYSGGYHQDWDGAVPSGCQEGVC